MNYVALLCALALSMICLNQERKQAAAGSPALWLSTIWMMRVASRSFNYWFPAGPTSVADPVILAALTVLGLVALVRRGPAVVELCRQNRAFVLFFIFMSMSVFWTDDVADSFKRWCRLLGDVTMAVIVLTEAKPLQALVSVVRRAVILLMPLSLVLSLYFPDLGIGYSSTWVGVTVDKNWFGLLCAVSVAFLLLNRTMRKRNPELAVDITFAGVPFEIPYLLLSVYLLFGGGGGEESRSSTSIVLLALSIGLFYFVDYVRRTQIRIGPLIAAFLVGVLFLQVLPRAMGRRTVTDHIIEDVLGKNVNLTDRADFWPLLVQKGMRHPWFGAGFDSFFSEEMQDEIQAELAFDETYFRPNQAHNGYLQLFLNLGFAGLLLLAFTIVGAIAGTRTQLQQDFEVGRVRLILLVFVLLSNYTEASLTRPTEFVWFLFLLAAVHPSGVPVEARGRQIAFRSKASHPASGSQPASAFPVPAAPTASLAGLRPVSGPRSQGSSPGGRVDVARQVPFNRPRQQ